jgi:UDP-3-O-[3-hydroxymyristoyl] glucosamine N-acyltransferase
MVDERARPWARSSLSERARAVAQAFRPRWFVNARTHYYRMRYRRTAEWGAGVQVHGALRLSGPGRIVIGDGCRFGASSGTNVIRASGSGTVRIGAGCELHGLDIAAADNVTIGSGVHIRGRLRLEDAGRFVLGDDSDVKAVDAIGTGDVVIGDGVRVWDRLRFEGAAHVTVGAGCTINVLHVSTTGDVSIGNGVRIRDQAHIGGQGGFAIGAGCVVDRGGLAVTAAGPTVTVRIGKGTVLNGLDVYASDDVTIGDRCRIGDCSMMTTDFHSTRPDRWSEDAPVKRGTITVGSNVWLAHRTVITKNVSIGDNSVVSIGTIVRDDVPENVIVSSHQQRIVKELPPS